MIESAKPRTTKREYTLCVRLEPSDPRKAKFIRGVSIECTPRKVHERAATLEAYLLLEYPSHSHKVVRIGEGKIVAEDISSLLEEDRRKVNDYLPQMLNKGKKELQKLYNKHFQIQGWTNWIG